MKDIIKVIKWKKEEEIFLAKNISLGFKELSKIMNKPYKTIHSKAKRMNLDLELAKNLELNRGLYIRESQDTPQSVIDFKKEATEFIILLICTDWSTLKIGKTKTI